MTPELPKVELPKPQQPKGEILDSLEKAYQLSEEVPTTPENVQESGKTAEDLAKVGSVGLEAGLTNFELTKDDNSVGVSSTTDDDDDTDEAQVIPGAGARTSASKKNNLAPSASPVVAEDKDDIEKEWVNKAKKIVEQTKTDPFLQERAVSRLQADYMKKRFNKDVKLPKEEA